MKNISMFAMIFFFTAAFSLHQNEASAATSSSSSKSGSGTVSSSSSQSKDSRDKSHQDNRREPHEKSDISTCRYRTDPKPCNKW